jgi:hypothetical protein
VSSSSDGLATPYSTLAVKGSLAALGRATRLAGALAPALILVVLAFVALAAVTRGSTGLVKIDDAAPPRTFRL